MSGAFERQLARHLEGYLEGRPPQPGQILLAEFHNSSVADRFAQATTDLLGDNGPDLEVDGRSVSLPTYLPESGAPTYVVRVVTEVSDEHPPQHVVSQGFATKMRNLIADSVHSNEPRAMLMVMEADATIDTLEASEKLFAESGPINLDTFRQELFDTSDIDSTQGRAFLKGLGKVIEDDPLHARDIQVLEKLSEIRRFVEQDNFEPIPELIGSLPQFITEDFFVDDQFREHLDEESLEEAVRSTLRDNKSHAETLRRAHDTGTDTHSRLLSSYQEETVDKIIEAPDWSEIKHSDIRKAKREKEVIRFDHLEITARRQQIFDPLEGTSRTRKSLLLVPENGSVAVTAIFIKDIEKTPYELIDHDGNKIGRTTKRAERITATLDGMDPSTPQFAQFLFYVGKKTTKGKPTHQFDIAVVPEWFYHATEDLSLDVDVADETFLAPGDQKLTLIPPERLDTQHEEREVPIEEDGQIIEFTGPLTLDPDPPGVLERVTCRLAPPDEIPISITFLLETTGAKTEEVILPIHLASIVNPEDWEGERHFTPPKLLTVDTNRGAIYTASEQGINLTDDALELLQIEEHIINEGDPRVRLVEGDSLDFGVIETEAELPTNLLNAYKAYFDHLDEREVTPSTDRWDETSQKLVENILAEYAKAVDAVGYQTAFSPYEEFRDLGTLRSKTSEMVWHTPFHPISLAYGLRIAKWRDEDLINHASDGFRREEFVNKFNPTGLLPYRSSRGHQKLLRGMPLPENALWQVYSAVESPGSVTPSYMERVVRDKLFTFVRAFPLLFKLHPDKQLVINLINLGDLRSVIKGLFEFYKKIDSSEFEPPTILLRIYGSEQEGEALNRFFTEGARSRLLIQLEKRNDEVVDLLRRNVHFVHAGRYEEANQKPAHITFFRGLLREEVGTMNQQGELPTGMLFDGLFPKESIDVDTNGGEIIYTVGFSAEPSDERLLPRVARVANALEAGYYTNSYHPNTAPKKNIQPAEGTDLTRIWDDSLWVVHVQPNVGIEFYLQPESNSDSSLGKVMIHYSDQYDSSSPNYDVITSTNKRRPYETSLQRAIEDAKLSKQLNSEIVLSTLVSVDGDLALKLQRATDTEIVEYVGFVGGLGLSRAILNEHQPDHVWIPISLNELTRHDRSYRQGESGLLQMDTTGKSSDDLCFVGIPRDETDLTLKMWVVETKGGSSSISKGKEQVRGAVENLREWFAPSRTYADEQILHAEFGKLLLDVARRMYNYGVIDESDSRPIEQRWQQLLEGEYNISFLTDASGRIGEVVRIRTDRLVTDVHLDDDVRAIEAPLTSLQLLENESISDILPDLSLRELAFQINVEKSRPAKAGLETESVPDSQSVEDHSDEPPTKTPLDTSTIRSEVDELPQTDTESQVTSTDSDSTREPSKSPLEDSEHRDVNPEGGSENQIEDQTEEPSRVENAQVDENQETEKDEVGEPLPSDRAKRIRKALNWLETSPEPEADVDPGQLASQLNQAFSSLGVDIHPPNPASVSIGPRKVGIDVIPKEGQKVETILRNLDTLSVHIKAKGDIVGTRVPEKGAVHLEIPHGDPRDIYLREGLAAIADETKDHLVVPVGVDTDNEHHSISLLDERHLLIGGATGSGKSNFLATIISSLAIAESPDDVSISILDPKGVDFGRFSNVPHVQEGGYFNTPVECTEHLLSLVNTTVVQRRRYLSEAGVASVSQLYEFGDEIGFDPLPYHVIVIDEYADLIMSVDDEDSLEGAVTRLAQIGRALGIVVLLATQRPSADIVSGKIKANFPCRVSFKLPSNTDSRVILDQPGAEDLQGSGDMIVISQSGEHLNLQGYFLTPMDAMRIIDNLSE